MSAAVDPVRVIPLEGAFNFRDLGGYRTVGGARLRWRTLFRSDGLSDLTGADLAYLDGLGLRTVIDLRTEAEVARRGRIEWPTSDLAYRHLPLLDVLPPADQYRAWADPAYVASLYLDMLDTAGTAIRFALETLCESHSYPVVYHCAAGKDRTGLLSALVLGLLGVPDYEIVNDYTLSQHATGRRLERLLAERRAGEVDQLGAVLQATSEVMSMFLDRFRSVHGSFAEYADGLGVPEAADHLRAILLEAEG